MFADPPGDDAARLAVGGEEAALSGEGEERHLPVHGGRAEPHRPVRPEAAAQPAGRQADARELSARSSRRWASSARRCCASRRRWTRHGERALGSPTGCRTSATCADDLAVVRSCWADGHQPLGRRVPDEHRLDPRRPAVAGVVGDVRPGHREPEPAGVRGHAGQRRRRCVNGPRNWGAGFMPAVYQGVRLQVGQRADPQPASAGRASTDAQQRGKLDLLNRLNRQHAADPPAADRAGRPHRQLRAGLPHAGRRPPKRSTSAGDRGDQAALRPGRPGDGDVRPAVPARPPAGRARRPLRAALPRRRQQVGRPHEHRDEPHRQLCRSMRPAGRRRCSRT